MTRSAARLRAFTMIEVFAVLALIMVLVSMLLPAVQSAREMARRTSCANHLMQIALATEGYHNAFGQLPTQLSGSDGSSVVGADNDRRLSAFVGLMPFLGHRDIAEMIDQPQDRAWQNTSYGMGMYDEFGMESADAAGDRSGKSDEAPWPRGGPEPFEKDYQPWSIEPVALRCPSDPGIGTPAMARTNYAICLGDGVVAGDSGPMKEVQGRFEVDETLALQTQAAMRGMFVPRVVMRMSDATDGLSHTILFGEIATDLGDADVRTHPAKGPGGKELRDDPGWARGAGLIDPDRPMFWLNSMRGSKLDATPGWRRGHRWADGMPLYTAFNTILPPNSEITLRLDRDNCWGILPPSSRHQGGTHVCLGDGAVRFISDSIDAGNCRQPTVYVGSSNEPGSESPFGVWGALGTRAGGELRVQDALNLSAVE